MNLRNPINKNCRECIYDPLDKGSAAQQIACCMIHDCAFHPVRPITATVIPQQLLDHLGISIDSLCKRARPLVRTASSCSVEGQIDRLADGTRSTHTNGVGRDIQSHQQQGTNNEKYL
jgi:hypothetical protein